MNKDYKELLRGYLDNSLTVNELQQFIELSTKDENADELSASIQSSLEMTDVKVITSSSDVKEQVFESILKQKSGKDTSIPSTRIRYIWKYAAAASVIGLIFTISYFFITPSFNKSSDVVVKKKNIQKHWSLLV